MVKLHIVKFCFYRDTILKIIYCFSRTIFRSFFLCIQNDKFAVIDGKKIWASIIDVFTADPCLWYSGGAVQAFRSANTWWSKWFKNKNYFTELCCTEKICSLLSLNFCFLLLLCNTLLLAIHFSEWWTANALKKQNCWVMELA